ncbi:cold shock domain-containing protein [Lichenihabitans sp. PAMC28606]|nr:cold shock domain-containing protein [Lichenihabitans sp. PAMC28606]
MPSQGTVIFVHVTAVEEAGLQSLSEGQRVAYEIEPDKKGKGSKAVGLTIL